MILTIILKNLKDLDYITYDFYEKAPTNMTKHLVSSQTSHQFIALLSTILTAILFCQQAYCFNTPSPTRLKYSQFTSNHCKATKTTKASPHTSTRSFKAPSALLEPLVAGSGLLLGAHLIANGPDMIKYHSYLEYSDQEVWREIYGLSLFAIVCGYGISLADIPAGFAIGGCAAGLGIFSNAFISLSAKDVYDDPFTLQSILLIEAVHLMMANTKAKESFKDRANIVSLSSLVRYMGNVLHEKGSFPAHSREDQLERSSILKINDKFILSIIDSKGRVLHKKECPQKSEACAEYIWYQLDHLEKLELVNWHT